MNLKEAFTNTIAVADAHEESLRREYATILDRAICPQNGDGGRIFDIGDELGIPDWMVARDVNQSVSMQMNVENDRAKVAADAAEATALAEKIAKLKSEIASLEQARKISEMPEIQRKLIDSARAGIESVSHLGEHWQSEFLRSRGWKFTSTRDWIAPSGEKFSVLYQALACQLGNDRAAIDLFGPPAA